MGRANYTGFGVTPFGMDADCCKCLRADYGFYIRLADRITSLDDDSGFAGLRDELRGGVQNFHGQSLSLSRPCPRVQVTVVIMRVNEYLIAEMRCDAENVRYLRDTEIVHVAAIAGDR